MPTASTPTANLSTNIVDFRGFDSSIILTSRGGIPRPHRGFPGKSESSNLSRDNVSREIGRMFEDLSRCVVCSDSNRKAELSSSGTNNTGQEGIQGLCRFKCPIERMF